MLFQKNLTARWDFGKTSLTLIESISARPHSSKLCWLLHLRLGGGQQKIPAVFKFCMYKVTSKSKSSCLIFLSRDRGEEKLAVVQNTPRQQFEIDDTPEPTPDYEQVRNCSLFWTPWTRTEQFQTGEKLEEKSPQSQLDHKSTCFKVDSARNSFCIPVLKQGLEIMSNECLFGYKIFIVQCLSSRELVAVWFSKFSG